MNLLRLDSLMNKKLKEEHSFKIKNIVTIQVSVISFKMNFTLLNKKNYTKKKHTTNVWMVTVLLQKIYIGNN